MRARERKLEHLRSMDCDQTSTQINEITQFNLRSYENNELVISHPFDEIADITKHFNHHSLPNSPISLLVINEKLSNPEFWSLLDFASTRLEPNGCIVIFGINNSVESQLRWKQLENDDNFRVTIDLFGILKVTLFTASNPPN